MSTPNNPFLPKNKSYSPLSPSSPINMSTLDYKNSVYNGLLMTVGILGSTFVVSKIKRDMAPRLSTGSAVSLATVTVFSSVAIDYGKGQGWIPKSM